ncbi:MAG: DNA replication/repair protein RecF [Actinomycetota bacterium]
MLLRRIELQDVRSYARAALDLSAGVTVLVGPNAQGKTNLLEAVLRAGTGASHRVSSDVPLVRDGAEMGIIRTVLETDAGRRRTVELEVASGRRTRTRVDGQDVRRSTEALGVLRVVLFAPEDVAIVRGDPSERRRFLDDLLSQRRPAFAAARSEYDRVLKQRNHLLKQARGLSSSAAEAASATLDVWTDQLVQHATSVVAARIAALHALAGPVDRFYRDLADRPEPVRLGYRSTADLDVVGDPGRGVPEREPIEEALRRALAEARDDERQRGVTLVGPHRDDVELTIGDLPARGYSSHGEAWSLALSLKLSTFEVLAEVGDRPVVLLDDVFAELDETRRARLAGACDRFDQVLVTAAVEADVPLRGAMVDVRLDGGQSSLHPRPHAAGGAA